MNLSEKPKAVDSVLSTKAVGSVSDVSQDLSMPEGQSIANLLNNEKEKEDTTEENKKDC
jgi:hypothetical protein